MVLFTISIGKVFMETSPPKIDFLNLYDFWNLIALLGFIATILGFIITIWQIIKTRKVAMAAKNAATVTRSAINRDIILMEISACIKTIEEVKGYLRDKKFNASLLRVTDLTSQFIQFQHIISKPDINFQEILTQLSILRESLERKIDSDIVPLDIVVANRKLTDISKILNNWIGKTRYANI